MKEHLREHGGLYLLMFGVVVLVTIILTMNVPERTYEDMTNREARSRQAAALEDIAATLRALCNAMEGCEP